LWQFHPTLHSVKHRLKQHTCYVLFLVCSILSVHQYTQNNYALLNLTFWVFLSRTSKLGVWLFVAILVAIFALSQKKVVTFTHSSQ
jgi:hypothetical protein